MKKKEIQSKHKKTLGNKGLQQYHAKRIKRKSFMIWFFKIYKPSAKITNATIVVV